MRKDPLGLQRCAITYFLLPLLIIVAAGSASAQMQTTALVDKRVRNGGFGVRAGAIAPSTWSVEDDDFGTTMSVGLGAFLETALRTGTSVRFATDIHNIASGSLNDQELFFTFMVGPRFLVGDRRSSILLRPGASLGIGYMGKFGLERHRVVDSKGDSTLERRDRINRTTYLTYAIELEMLFTSNRNQNFATFVDFGFLGTITGGNSETDAFINPTVTAHLGVMY